MPTHSNYELMRQANIAARWKMFSETFPETFKEKADLTVDNVNKLALATGHPKARSQSSIKRKLSFGKVSVTRSSPPRTRRRCATLGQPNYLENDIDEDDKPAKPKKVLKPKRTVNRTWVKEHDRVILNPEDITHDMLNSIARSSGNKKYSSGGTCCHQCRQKTLDQKTVCRSDECFGIRGQFCGPCLLNRYGEDVAKALKDPDWKCPVCRDICNCSFCRPKKGKWCTGILIHEARKEGFTNVKDFLISAKESSDEDE